MEYLCTERRPNFKSRKYNKKYSYLNQNQNQKFYIPIKIYAFELKIKFHWLPNITL